MSNLEQKLLRHPFLKGIPTENLKMLAEDAATMVFKPGEMILRQGRQANFLFLVVSGKVTLGLLRSDTGPIAISTLGKGEALGWSWMFPPYRWKFDAKAQTRVEVLAIEGKPLMDKMGRYPLLGYELMKHMARTLSRRLESTRHQLVRVFHQKTKRDLVYLPQPMF